MNKSLKGGIAAGAASLLLLGGAGTFALWSDSVSLDGGDIQSGRLELNKVGTSAWADLSSGTAKPIADITQYRVVPGDTLTYTSQAQIVADGDNLKATIAADPAGVTGSAALKKDIAVTTATTVGGQPLTTITEAHHDKTVDIVVTFKFNEASTNESQLQTMDLEKFNLGIQQAR